MAASSYGNFKWISVTHLEKGIIFLSYCYPERIIYDDACFLKKFRVNPVRKEVDSSVEDAGEDGYGSGQISTFQNHVDRWCKANCNPQDCDELHGVSVCVYVHLYADIASASFFLGGGRLKTYDSKGNKIGGNNRSMLWP